MKNHVFVIETRVPIEEMQSGVEFEGDESEHAQLAKVIEALMYDLGYSQVYVSSSVNQDPKETKLP